MMFTVTVHIQGEAKKVSPKVFCCFSQQTVVILLFYFLTSSTFKCEVKRDSVEKRRSYTLFNMTAYWFFNIQNVPAENAV